MARIRYLCNNLTYKTSKLDENKYSSQLKISASTYLLKNNWSVPKLNLAGQGWRNEGGRYLPTKNLFHDQKTLF